MNTHYREILLSVEFDSLYDEAIKLDEKHNDKVNKNPYLYALKKQADRQLYENEKLR